MAKKKMYDDDDGRTIADMSGVERRPLIIPKLPKKAKEQQAQSEQQKKPEWEQEELNKDQRRALIGGSLGAAILVLVIFALIIALVIFLIGFFGH